jgi:hypothetical protein
MCGHRLDKLKVAIRTCRFYQVVVGILQQLRYDYDDAAAVRPRVFLILSPTPPLLLLPELIHRSTAAATRSNDDDMRSASSATEW